MIHLNRVAMFPIYNHRVTPLRDVCDAVQDIKTSIKKRSENVRLVDESKRILNDPAANMDQMCAAGDKLIDIKKSKKTAISLYERAQKNGNDDAQIYFNLGSLYSKKWQESKPVYNVMSEPKIHYLNKAIENLEKGLERETSSKNEHLLAELYADHRAPNPEIAIDFAFEKLEKRQMKSEAEKIILGHVAHSEYKVGGMSTVYVFTKSRGFSTLPQSKKDRVTSFLRDKSATEYLKKIK